MKHWAIGRSDFIDLMGIASAVAVDRVSVYKKTKFYPGPVLHHESHGK